MVDHTNRCLTVSVVIPCSRLIEIDMLRYWFEVSKYPYVGEVIVVLNGQLSTQNETIISSFGDNDGMVFTTSQTGASTARNHGAKLSKFELIHFLDDDDLVCREFYSYGTKILTDNMELVGVASDVYVLPDGDTTKKYIARRPLDIISMEDMLYDNYVGLTSCVMVRRDKFFEVFGFDESLSAREDYHLWLRLSKLGRFKRIKKPLIHWVEHRSTRSLTNSQDILKHKQALRKIDELREKMGAEFALLFNKRQARSSNYKYLGRVATRIGVAGYKYRILAFILYPTVKGLLLLLPDIIFTWLRRLTK